MIPAKPYSLSSLLFSQKSVLLVVLFLSIADFSTVTKTSTNAIMLTTPPPPTTATTSATTENTCQASTNTNDMLSSSSRSMKLSASFLSNLSNVYTTPLKYISFGTEEAATVTEATDTISFRDASTKESDAEASIVFIIRRPGCILCREHGQQLTKFYNNYNAANGANIAMWGIIKEVGVDDVGLVDFYKNYFTFPLYRDVDLTTYHSFGYRSIKLTTWNPIRLYQGYQEMKKRLSSADNLTGNLKGEGMIQGGIVIVDHKNDIRYAFEEDIGSELVMDDIEKALDDIVSSNQQPKVTAESTTTVTTTA